MTPNRGSPPAILLRGGYREGRTVKTRTLANLSRWPPAQIEALRRALRGEALVPPEEAFKIVRSRPHGHLAAIVGTMRRLELDQVIARRPSRQRSLVLGMIAARLIAPASKLATARGFDPRTQHSTVGEVLGLEAASADDLYEAMDWVVARQGRIEAALARRHLQEGTLVLLPQDALRRAGDGGPGSRRGRSWSLASSQPGAPSLCIAPLRDGYSVLKT